MPVIVPPALEIADARTSVPPPPQRPGPAPVRERVPAHSLARDRPKASSCPPDGWSSPADGVSVPIGPSTPPPAAGCPPHVLAGPEWPRGTDRAYGRGLRETGLWRLMF